MKVNKKGAVSVFLLMILTAMIAMTAAFIYAARESAVRSFGDGVLNLSMRSVLSRFDLDLKQRYGLFAFEETGQEAAILRSFADYSFSDSGIARLEKIEVSEGEYSLGNFQVLKKQVMAHMKLAAAKDLLSNLEKRNLNKKSGEKTKGIRDRTLRNRKIIEGLPSAPFRDSSPGLSDRIEELKSNLGSVGEVFDKTKDSYLLDRYILLYFKSLTTGPEEEASFFDCEVEYILEGACGNKENREKTQQGLVLFRSALNAVFLYTNPEKRAETLAAAELLTPGPAALITQTVLIGTWSLAEADNDVRLLSAGKPVALLKSNESWAIDLDAVLNNKTEGCVDTGNRNGLYYEDYLMIFLHFMNEKLKLARMADLIQINMKGTCDRDFLIRGSGGGLRLKAKINGREYEYDTEY
ncbi:DUF5702 domain-containing protein [bacterium 210820-DFI.6.37]|nr:DUF5702 domain-containing protein [bacterium 210820-DFI.6.37]